jgi:hypothetical protein
MLPANWAKASAWALVLAVLRSLRFAQALARGVKADATSPIATVSAASVVRVFMSFLLVVVGHVGTTVRAADVPATLSATAGAAADYGPVGFVGRSPAAVSAEAGVVT